MNNKTIIIILLVSFIIGSIIGGMLIVMTKDDNDDDSDKKDSGTTSNITTVSCDEPENWTEWSSCLKINCIRNGVATVNCGEPDTCKKERTRNTLINNSCRIIVQSISCADCVNQGSNTNFLGTPGGSTGVQQPVGSSGMPSSGSSGMPSGGSSGMPSSTGVGLPSGSSGTPSVGGSSGTPTVGGSIIETPPFVGTTGAPLVGTTTAAPLAGPTSGNPPSNPELCEWSVWRAWSSCSVSCGGGTRERMRNQNPLDGSATCNLDEWEKEDCSTQNCPINCVWNNWSQWTQCSNSCGNGNKERTRTEQVSAQNGGNPCDGSNQESQPCYIQGCVTPVNCEWDNWQAWTQCSTTCGNDGVKSRDRIERIVASNGGQNCVGDYRETKSCYIQDCVVPVNCEWNNWQLWSPCSKTCGSDSVRARLRSKRTEASNGGQNCVGDYNEVESCAVVDCPCEFTQWSEWSTCSTTCGEGKQGRTRDFIDEMICQGLVIALSSKKEIKSCQNLQRCYCRFIEHNGVDKWSEWGECIPNSPGSCGSDAGTRTRYKEYEDRDDCIAPPSVAEYESCDIQCILSVCSYTEWSEWSNCQGLNNNCFKTRSRNRDNNLNFLCNDTNEQKSCPCFYLAPEILDIEKLVPVGDPPGPLGDSDPPRDVYYR